MNQLLKVEMTNLGIVIAIWNFERIHCTNHGLHCHENILINQSDVLSFIIFRVAS